MTKKFTITQAVEHLAPERHLAIKKDKLPATMGKVTQGALYKSPR